jgi:hypothetical protein
MAMIMATSPWTGSYMKSSAEKELAISDFKAL